MCTNVNSGREALLASTKDDDGNLRSLLDLLQRRYQLVHHRDINDVQRWILERDFKDWRLAFKPDASSSDDLSCHQSSLLLVGASRRDSTALPLTPLTD